MYFAEMIALEPFDHVIDCINVSYLTHILTPDPRRCRTVGRCHIQLPN